MPFTQGSIIVRTLDIRGLDTLALANELAATDGVASVSPNFIQQVSPQPAPALQPSTLLPNLVATTGLDRPLAQVRSGAIQPSAQFLPFQWHLNSVPLLSCLTESSDSLRSLVTCMAQPQTDEKSALAPARADLRISEVWQQGQQGEGVVVAVLDDFIQWDHPALRDSLYQVSHPNRCESEVHGWDFSSLLNQQAMEGEHNDLNAAFDFCNWGDAETRMEADEFGYLKSLLDDAFLLSDEELLQRYPADAQRGREAGANESQIAQYLRRELQGRVTYEFHGTAVSSVVAARSSQMLGVAPQAEILPVRFVGLNLSLSVETYALGIRYAADRGADIINISYGLGFPTDEGTNTIHDVLEKNPDLVIVSASGNDTRDRISRPAALPEVLSVGASNHSGQRAPYSNFGSALDLIAPGGDTSEMSVGGLLLAGGTWYPEFWSGLPEEASLSGDMLDRKGSYYFGNGTSFAAPAVAGVLALMKGEDPQRRLSWMELTEILKETARLDRLALRDPERAAYERWAQNSNGELPVSDAAAKAYFLGAGLVDAEAAVREVQRKLLLSEER